jgi:hypothetical protein
MRYVEHDIVGSPMLDEGSQLVFDIFRLLSGTRPMPMIRRSPVRR